jgi:hypothetical protein
MGEVNGELLSAAKRVAGNAGLARPDRYAADGDKGRDDEILRRTRTDLRGLPREEIQAVWWHRGKRQIWVASDPAMTWTTAKVLGDVLDDILETGFSRIVTGEPPSEANGWELLNLDAIVVRQDGPHGAGRSNLVGSVPPGQGRPLGMIPGTIGDSFGEGPDAAFYGIAGSQGGKPRPTSWRPYKRPDCGGEVGDACSTQQFFDPSDRGYRIPD